jgi:hypothetical protein
MHQDYCFRCGCYTRIDETTKLCEPCYQRWAGRPKPA